MYLLPVTLSGRDNVFRKNYILSEPPDTNRSCCSRKAPMILVMLISVVALHLFNLSAISVSIIRLLLA